MNLLRHLFESGISVLALGWLGQALAASDSVPSADLQRVQLAAWSASVSGMKEESYTLGEGEVRSAGWGRYSPNERAYFPEFLPALFERTLSFPTLPAGRAFTWVFTGPRVGLTLMVSDRRVELRTQFHDSPGYATLAGKPERYPRLAAPALTFEFGAAQGLRAVTVQLDHTLTLTVSLNGREVHRRLWLEGFQRHQVRLEGRGAAVAFKLLQPAPAAARVTVNPAERHQTMLGWGGITRPTAYRELGAEGRRRWWELVVDYNLLCQRAYPVGGMSRSLFVSDATAGFMPRASSHQLRVFGAFSRRVSAGMQRVAAHTNHPDLLVTTFAGDGGAATAVMVNRSTVPLKVELDWPGVVFTESELTDPYHQNTALLAELATATGRAVVVPPGGIVTRTSVPRRTLPSDFSVS